MRRAVLYFVETSESVLFCIDRVKNVAVNANFHKHQINDITKSFSSPGSDNISIQLLLNVGPILCSILRHFFLLLFKNGSLPSVWCLPVYKKNSHSLRSNYSNKSHKYLIFDNLIFMYCLFVLSLTKCDYVPIFNSFQ